MESSIVDTNVTHIDICPNCKSRVEMIQVEASMPKVDNIAGRKVKVWVCKSCYERNKVEERYF